MSLDRSVFQYCKDAVLDGSQDDMFRCISDRVEELANLRHNRLSMLSSYNSYYGYLVVFSGALAFFMQVGFAMLCAGCVRKKNAQNTMLKNLLDACGSAVAFFFVGYSISQSSGHLQDGFTFTGNEHFFGTGNIDSGNWYYQYVFAAAAVTIVAGTLAERCKMSAYILYSMFLAGFVYPVVAHAVWSKNGVLSAFALRPLLGTGMVDFAGGGAIHLMGGATALIATVVLGSRRGRFYDVNTGCQLETPNKLEGHSKPLQLLGTMFLWCGWYGFNAGLALLLPQQKYRSEIAALAAVNSTLAAASGGLSALMTKLIVEGRHDGNFTKYDLVSTMNGCLSGLVSITAGCGTLENWAALIVGIVAGWIYVFSSALLVRLKIDDAVDAIPVHMFNGCWSLIAAGLFSSQTEMRKVYESTASQHGGWLYSMFNGSPFDVNLLICQIVGVVSICLWTFLIMAPFFIFLNYLGWFRSDSVSELVGLDLLYHGESACKVTSVKKRLFPASKPYTPCEERDVNEVIDAVSN